MRIAVWGGFDVENYGDLLFPRIFTHEMGRRLPGAEVVAYAPLGSLNPMPMDEGVRAVPLGTWSPEACEAFAAAFDLVVVGGGDIIHVRDDLYPGFYGAVPEASGDLRPSLFYLEGLGEFESRCPMAYNAVGVPFELSGPDAERTRRALARRRYLAVRDPASRERLLGTGLEREIRLVPDTAFLLPRILPPAAIAERLGALRREGFFPEGLTAMVVQANGYLPAASVEAIAEQIGAVLRRHPDLAPVLVELGRCHEDGRFADELASRLSGPVHRVPATAGARDLASAIAGAGLFLGASMHGQITALSFGVPALMLNLQGIDKLEHLAAWCGRKAFVVRAESEVADAVEAARGSSGTPDAALIAHLAAEIDEHFDRMAALARESERFRSGPPAAAPPAAAKGPGPDDVPPRGHERTFAHSRLLRLWNALRRKLPTRSE